MSVFNVKINEDDCIIDVTLSEKTEFTGLGGPMVNLSQKEYDKLAADGQISENTYYFIEG